MLRTQTSSSRASQSSSLFSASPTHKLHRVAFQGEDSAHWAILLPVKTGVPIGVFVHIGVEKDRITLKPIRHELLIHNINISHTAATEAILIPGAEVTEYQLVEAAEAVFYRRNNSYHMLTNNCQHFCIDVVTWLHYHYPNSVSKDAIRDCEGKGTTAVALRKFIFWTRFTKDGREAYLKAKQAKAAQEAATQHFVRSDSGISNRTRMSIN